jgi:molybdopterin synthase catalytic subunit
MQIIVSEARFDPGEKLSAFTDAAKGAGAIVSFTGLVRDEGGTLSRMEIEHYPGMTERALETITREAIERWSLADALVIHRFGALQAGEVIMMVATASRHRKDAFEAADFLMDYLKSRAPFWKKEFGEAGQSWVAASSSSLAALKRW